MFDIENFFINPESYRINFDYVESIHEFAQLKECKQPYQYHTEGSAWDHTKNCVEVGYDIMEKSLFGLPLDRKRSVILAVLFHDIGKISTTFEKNGVWHSYGHEVAGEKITRRILWDADFGTRETICSLVRWHMERCGFTRQTDLIKRIMQLSYCTNLNTLYWVFYCDIMGSIPEKEETRKKDLKILDFFEYVLIDFINYDELTNQDFDMRKFFFNNEIEYCSEKKEDKKVMYLMIGLAGSGKDTWIKNNIPDVVVLSRDDIRIELGYCTKDQKFLGSLEQEEKVSTLFNERMKKALENGDKVVISNTNLVEKYRKPFVEIAQKYNYTVHFVYIEAPSLEECIKRREGQIKPEVIYKMQEKLEWPTPFEYDKLTIIKQEFSKDGECRENTIVL